MLRRFRAAALAVLAACSLPAPAAGSPRPFLVVPRDNSLLPEGKNLVVGLAGVDKGLARVEVNGKVTGFASVEDRAFHLEVNLPAGTNSLRFTAGAWVGEATLRAAKGASFRYHPKLEECRKCHADPTGGVGYAVPPPVEKVCSPCHKGKATGKFVHGPAALGQCTACHDPHGSPWPGLAKQERTCFACHEPFPPGESLHSPAKEGRCNRCHNPHASNRAAHLKGEGNSLCTECHQYSYHENHRTLPQGENSRVVVPDDFPRHGNEILCTGCHTPHRSAGKRLLKDGKDLCKRCHPF